MVEMGSHLTKRVPVQSHAQLEKSLCDFTGTIFVQCENTVVFLRLADI